jgi:hypothetical protein
MVPNALSKKLADVCRGLGVKQIGEGGEERSDELTTQFVIEAQLAC